MKMAFVCIGERPHAKYAVESFKKYAPFADIVQITDHFSPEVEGVDMVIRKEYDGHMMLFLIKSFAELWEDTFITTADDCILDAPIQDWLDGDYDVAIVRRTDIITTERRKKFPYTNGLLFVKNKDFYKDCYKSILCMGEIKEHGVSYLDWLGDMACIKEVIDSGKYKIKLLPEELFCQKPMFDGDGKVDGAILWHYSGTHRKPWMVNHGKGKQ